MQISSPDTFICSDLKLENYELFKGFRFFFLFEQCFGFFFFPLICDSVETLQ